MRVCLSLLVFAFFVTCKVNQYNVKSSLLSKENIKKITFGSIINRDYKTPKSIAKDLRELLMFELMSLGYDTSNINEQNLLNDKSKMNLSDIPIGLRKSVGESLGTLNSQDKLLDSLQIKNILNSEGRDLFIQGVVSIHSTDRILENKDSIFIFLNVFDEMGRLVLMINSSFDEQIIGHSDPLRKVVLTLASEFKKNVR